MAELADHGRAPYSLGWSAHWLGPFCSITDVYLHPPFGFCDFCGGWLPPRGRWHCPFSRLPLLVDLIVKIFCWRIPIGSCVLLNLFLLGVADHFA